MATNNAINIPKEEMQRPFTLLIAANDSSAKGKSMADYVCDGTEDESEINAAIALLTSGGEVKLLEGTYNITSTINMASNIKLSGCGNGTILKITDSVNAGLNVISIITPGNLSGRKENIIISDLKLYGNKANNSSGTQNGLYIYGDCRNICIDKIMATSFRDNGIYSSGINSQVYIDDLIVTNSTFSENTGCGVLHGSNYSGEVENTTQIYSNNHFLNNASWGIDLYNLGDVSNCWAKNNTVGGIACSKAVGNKVWYTLSAPTYSGSSHIGINAYTIASSNDVAGYNNGISCGILTGNRVVAKVACCNLGIFVSGNYFSVNPTTASGYHCLKPSNTNYTIIGNFFNIGANNYCINTEHGWGNISNNIFSGTSSACIKLGQYSYYTHISDNCFAGGTIGIDNSINTTNIRCLNNTGNGVTTLISGTVNETAGNTSF